MKNEFLQQYTHETTGLLSSFTTYQKKSTSYTHPHTVTKKEKSIFYSSKHMKSQGCCRPLLLYQKNPHLIRTPIRSRKKRNGFFIVVNTLVATKWLLILGNFETLGSKFRHETTGMLPSFTTYKKNPHLIRPLIRLRKKRNDFLQQQAHQQPPVGY